MIAWPKKSQSMVYSGYRNIIRKDFQMPNGRVEPFDIVDGASFVTIASITTDDNLLLIRQFRPGPESITIEFPSGQVDGEESIEAAARRELLEETGFECQDLRMLKKITSAYSHVDKHCFLATGCRNVAACSLEENEYLETFQMPVDEFRRTLNDPTNDTFTDIDIAYLALDALNRL